MSLADDLVQTLEGRAGKPVEITQEGHRLEVYPIHSKLGAGFTLWRRAADGTWQVALSGHTEHGNILAPEGETRLPLSKEMERMIARLLDAA